MGSSPVARRYLGNRCYFLFLRVLRCFSSPRSLRCNASVSGSLPTGCPIRTSAGQWVFAPRRSFSQLITSFFASESQGIPHAPLSVPLSLYNGANKRLMFDFAFFALALVNLAQIIDSRSLAVLTQSYNSIKTRFHTCQCPRLESDKECRKAFPYLFRTASAGRRSFSVVLGRVELPTSTLSV